MTEEVGGGIIKLTNKKMNYGQNSGYGRAKLDANVRGLGKTFIVATTSAANRDMNKSIFIPDTDGVIRTYTTPTLALGQCVAGRGDVIIIDPSYTTLISDAEYAIADTKGVAIYGNTANSDGALITVWRPTATLPASTAADIFTVNGLCRLVAIIGIVTTVIQTQGNNTKLKTVSESATTDICAVLDISAKAVASRFSITGTFANAMINTAKGVPVAKQATEIIVDSGSIQLDCAATNTGSVRWCVQYIPIETGATIIAA